MIRGEGDAEALRIIAQSFSQDPELYKYLKTLEVIKEATPVGSELVISLESSIYNLIRAE